MGGNVIRKTIFWLHLATGVLAGVVILIMSVTGVLLMYQRQVTSWADGAKITRVEGQERLAIASILEKVAGLSSNAPTAITVNSNPNLAMSIAFGRERTLFVNPYTGEVVSEGGKAVRGFFQTMINWHRWLAMSGEKRELGKAITGACNLGFLFLVISGLYLWLPRTWNRNAVGAVTVPDLKASGKARDWNWHNVAGFWFWIPLFLVVATAPFFSYTWTTELLYKVTGNEPPPKPAAPAGRTDSSTKGNGFEVKDFDAYLKLGAEQARDWRMIILQVPKPDAKSVSLTVDRGNGARPDLRSQLTINPQTAQVEKVEAYHDYNSARKMRLWIRWIHTGEAGGFVGQTIAGLASAAGALLVWTGLALAWRRFFRRKTEAA